MSVTSVGNAVRLMAQMHCIHGVVDLLKQETIIPLQAIADSRTDIMLNKLCQHLKVTDFKWGREQVIVQLDKYPYNAIKTMLFALLLQHDEKKKNDPAIIYEKLEEIQNTMAEAIEVMADLDPSNSPGDVMSTAIQYFQDLYDENYRSPREYDLRVQPPALYDAIDRQCSSKEHCCLFSDFGGNIYWTAPGALHLRVGWDANILRSLGKRRTAYFSIEWNNREIKQGIGYDIFGANWARWGMHTQWHDEPTHHLIITLENDRYDIVDKVLGQGIPGRPDTWLNLVKRVIAP